MLSNGDLIPTIYRASRCLMCFCVLCTDQKTEARDRALGITPAAGLGGIALQPLDTDKERSKLLKGSKTSEQNKKNPLEK